MSVTERAIDSRMRYIVVCVCVSRAFFLSLYNFQVSLSNFMVWVFVFLGFLGKRGLGNWVYKGLGLWVFA